MARWLTIGAALVLGMGLLAWLGLQWRPKAWEPFGGDARLPRAVTLPEGLPAPVDRFYRTVYGDDLPMIQSMVVSGRARLRIMGLPLWARYRFTHDAGQGYRHYIEVTWFGLPVLRIDETYLDGAARLELPFGVTENAPKVDQAANLGLWAESVWLPAILVTDPRVRWEAVDEETAWLLVPFGDETERLLVRFDPDTGLIRMLEAMRYQEADSSAKTLWICEAHEWSQRDGQLVLTDASLTWFDEGRPWAVFGVDDLVYNAKVAQYIRARGR
jgi:hypothetical protein